MDKIIIGSDHAGLNLKKSIIEYLENLNFDVKDIGTHTTESCDYPIIAKQLSKEILAGNYERGILICGTGLGMAITANREKGIRAVAVSDTTSAKCSRSHNNANVLCLGERIVGDYLAKDIVKIWLDTEFNGGRHNKRVEMIDID